MKQFFSKIFGFIFAAALCVGIICLCVETVSFDTNYHKEIVDRDYISSRLKVKNEQIDGLLFNTTEYIKGKENNMQYETKGGNKLFNQREIEHMQDVQYLFKVCRQVEYLCLAVCVVLLMLLMVMNGSHLFYYLARGCTLFLVVAAVFISAMLLWHYIDFESFWTAFHKVAFKNDLWQMQPGDAIIIIYSLEFFTAVVRKIIFRMVYVLGAILLVSVLGWAFLPQKRGGMPIVG